MAVFVPTNLESSFYYITQDVEGGLVGRYYLPDPQDIPAPFSVKATYDEHAGQIDSNGAPLKPSYKEVEYNPSLKKSGRPSLFNRYELFFYDNFNRKPNGEGEPVFDKPDRLAKYISTASGVSYTDTVLRNPTAQNLINWSKNLAPNTGAVEYDWPDFLWCKNYGVVPNNYMVTLRRFVVPPTDDIFGPGRHPSPDVGRLITWVDGETNKWENAGLKFKTSLTWKEMESEIQVVQAQDNASWGNEGGMFGEGSMIGGFFKTASMLLDSGKAEKNRSTGNREPVNPYQDSNKVYGPVDVIKKMYVREKGINFEQTFTLTFEYELRSIDGINPRVAFMDLLANILMVVTNRGNFWGGEIKYWGGKQHQHVSPLGDPSKLAKGDYKGYFDSLVNNVRSGIEKLLKGQEFFSAEGIENFFKGIGGNLMDNIMGGGLDKAGRPGVQAVNSLLTGEPTGQWHIMVGNPANPILSVGNLIMEGAEIDFSGQLGPDDFPTKLKVVCTLKPAKPRERQGIIDMFHRNGRIYTTYDPAKIGQKPNKRTDRKRKNKNKDNNANPSASNTGNQSTNPDEQIHADFLTLSDDKFFTDKAAAYAYRFANWDAGDIENANTGTVSDLVLKTTQGIF